MGNGIFLSTAASIVNTPPAESRWLRLTAKAGVVSFADSLWFTVNFKIVVSNAVLSFNILLDNFVCHIAAAAAEIAPRPKMPAPACFPKMRIFTEKLMRCLALDPLHKTADRHLRRNRDKQVDMVLRRHMPLDYLNIFLPTNLPDHVSDAQRHSVCQKFFAVFCDSHQVQVY